MLTRLHYGNSLGPNVKSEPVAQRDSRSTSGACRQPDHPHQNGYGLQGSSVTNREVQRTNRAVCTGSGVPAGWPL
jgi:hypothetical protein